MNGIADLVKYVSVPYNKCTSRREGFETAPRAKTTFYCRRIQNLKQQAGYEKINPAVKLHHEGGIQSNTFSTNVNLMTVLLSSNAVSTKS